MLRFRVVNPKVPKKVYPHTAACSLPCPRYLTGGSAAEKRLQKKTQAARTASTRAPDQRALPARARARTSSLQVAAKAT